MMDKPQDGLDEQRKALLKSKLGSLLGWSKPQIVKTVGPYDPEPFDVVEARLGKIIDDCIDWLGNRSSAQIDILLEGSTDDAEKTLSGWRQFRSEDIDRLSRRPLPWYAGGFGHPDHIADFPHWCKMPTFTIDETLLLSVGVEPGAITPRELKSAEREDQSKLWPALQFLVRRREQLHRRFDPQAFKWSVQPSEFLTWAERTEFEVHPEFTRLLKKYHVASPLPMPPVETQRPDKREIDTIARLLVVMAIDHLGYDPGQARSPIAKEIADLSAKFGLSVSNDTVRKYLKVGASFLPEGWKDR